MRIPARSLLVIHCFISPMVGISSGCGGSQATAQHTGAPRQDDESDSTGSANSTGCSGETCFDCGEAMCLQGFYCDQGLSSGPGCSWLPECGQKASCRCVQGVLGSSCTCEERDNGVYVRCP